MRLDGISWQETKMKSVYGFLSTEGDTVIFTKYRDGYEDHANVLFTKQELKTNRFLDKMIGKASPEKEMFRIEKGDMTDFSVMVMDPVTAGGKTYYAAYATFKVAGKDYALTYNPNTQEETTKLEEILA